MKGVKGRSNVSDAMPWPLCWTVKISHSRPSRTDLAQLIWTSSKGVNLAALPTMFIRHCYTRKGSTIASPMTSSLVSF
jgi:hypothetical protein